MEWQDDQNPLKEKGKKRTNKGFKEKESKMKRLPTFIQEIDHSKKKHETITLEQPTNKTISLEAITITLDKEIQNPYFRETTEKSPEYKPDIDPTTSTPDLAPTTSITFPVPVPTTMPNPREKYDEYLKKNHEKETNKILEIYRIKALIQREVQKKPARLTSICRYKYQIKDGKLEEQSILPPLPSIKIMGTSRRWNTNGKTKFRVNENLFKNISRLSRKTSDFIRANQELLWDSIIMEGNKNIAYELLLITICATYSAIFDDQNVAPNYNLTTNKVIDYESSSDYQDYVMTAAGDDDNWDLMPKTEFEVWINKKIKFQERISRIKLEQEKINMVHKLEEKIQMLEEESLVDKSKKKKREKEIEKIIEEKNQEIEKMEEEKKSILKMLEDCKDEKVILKQQHYIKINHIHWDLFNTKKISEEAKAKTKIELDKAIARITELESQLLEETEEFQPGSRMEAENDDDTERMLDEP